MPTHQVHPITFPEERIPQLPPPILIIRLQPVRSRELTPRRQLVVRILIPLGRDILVVPLLIFPVLRF